MRNIKKSDFTNQFRDHIVKNKSATTLTRITPEIKQPPPKTKPHQQKKAQPSNHTLHMTFFLSKHRRAIFATVQKSASGHFAVGGRKAGPPRSAQLHATFALLTTIFTNTFLCMRDPNYFPAVWSGPPPIQPPLIAADPTKTPLWSALICHITLKDTKFRSCVCFF